MTGLLLCAGCATSTTRSAPTSIPPQKQSSTPLAPENSRPAIVCANDTVKVRVETAQGVTVGDYRREQLTRQIEERLEAKKALNKSVGEDRRYEVTITLTSYQKGSSLERLISGKMGQIDINSIVRLRDVTADRQLSEFGIRENYDRGGVSGFSTSYRDAESSFADGVAVALTGQASPRLVRSE